MQMLTKFESKSPRVKGIAFHPKQPLLAATLHNGTIQLWNYQMGTLVDRYDEHDGPVRGICFHPTQPIFVSGGDDYKIKVWNYKQRKCLFTLTGHLDYVRTTFFHREYPWILSASDDQTIRIWNWQSRTCIAILTGHNHYIMSAQFHPTEDLIVSASMDLTIRVWDITGLKKKHQAHQAPMSMEEQLARANQGQADLFGNTDAVVKYVLEGHDRGINWASFHPTLPLIISCGDDRQIKLWRMSDTKAWEVDTCRGHFNNVSSCLFHPRQELVLSDGEDKTIRVWDMTKRTGVQTFRREHDRFWVLTSHPHLNLFAAGHDNGLIVFKLERERPAFAVSGTSLYYVRDKTIRMHDLQTGKENNVMTLKKFGSVYAQPKSLSYNPAEKAVIVTSVSESGIYELIALPREGTNGEIRDSATEGKRGQGTSGIFVARNRLAVLDKTGQSIEIRDLNNSLTKTIKPPVQTTEIFYGGTASLLLSTPTSIILYDIQQQKVLSELTTPPVKYVVWSVDGNSVALLSKHTITIANKTLTQSSLIHETIRIKSAAWDDSGILIYTTLNHIKYALPQGDNGIIKTLEQPVYLTRIKGSTVFCLDRTARPRTIQIDPTEYRFKLALFRKNYDEVLQIIRNSNLVGQSIIAYLQKKGYPEIALHFVQDPTTRFDLAIECGNLTVALEMAKELEKTDVWNRLGEQALKQGNHPIVELAYQKTKNFDKLSFLYLITGNTKKLGMMQGISLKRGDQMSRFQNSLYLNDVESRIAVLRETGMHALAYHTAKANGLEDLAEEILVDAGMTDDDVPTTAKAGPSTLRPPPVVTSQTDKAWPIKSLGESYFDKALAAGAADGGEIAYANGYTEGADAEQTWLSEDEGAAEGDEDDAVEDDGWGLDEEEFAVNAEEQGGAVPEEEHVDLTSDVSPGVGENEHWTRNSPLAIDHAAAGSFESAMQLLNRQIGAVDFEPLKPYFLQAYQAAHVYVNANPSLPPLQLNVRRNPESVELREALPFISFTLESIKEGDLQDGLKLFTRGKFVESLAAFQQVLKKLLLLVVKTDAEATEVIEIVELAREYVLGLTLETERQKLVTEEPDNLSRSLDLAAFFTHCKLQPAHIQLSLRSAMRVYQKAGNNATAAVFARRLVDMKPADAKVVSQARSVITQGDRNPRDAVEVTYDHFSEFDICAASLTPILRGSPSVKSGYSGAKYLPEYKDSVCRVDGISQIGLAASGLRNKI